MVTLFDVAQQAGVSVMTVSRILRGHPGVKESTRKRVLRVMDELHYAPHGSVAEKRSFRNILALLVPDLTNPFFTFIARGMEDVARRNGYRVILASTDEDLAKERNSLAMCLNYHVAGILICPVGDRSVTALTDVIQRSVPVVLVDRGVPGVVADIVKGNVEESSYALVSHLIALGHRSIAVVTGPLDNESSRERVAGYQRACDDHGLAIGREYIHITSMLRDGSAEFIDRLLALPDPPSALFVANIFQYAKVYQRITALGQRVPESLSVVGFGNADEAIAIDSLLTAAVQPAYSFGSLGTQMLLERINGMTDPPRRMVLESRLLFRGSAGRPAGMPSSSR